MPDPVERELAAIRRRQEFIIALLFEVLTSQEVEMATIQDLFDAVESETSVDASILALVDQLVALVRGAGVDPVKLDQALATIASNKQKIVDSVNANTPPPPPVPD